MSRNSGTCRMRANDNRRPPVIRCSRLSRACSGTICATAETPADGNVLTPIEQRERRPEFQRSSGKSRDHLVRVHLAFIDWVQLGKHACSCSVPLPPPCERSSSPLSIAGSAPDIGEGAILSWTSRRKKCPDRLDKTRDAHGVSAAGKKTLVDVARNVNR